MTLKNDRADAHIHLGGCGFVVFCKGYMLRGLPSTDCREEKGSKQICIPAKPY